MTIEELSNAFDTLLNSYSNQVEAGLSHPQTDIVLDEYEKSLFLTEAQNQIVVELYTGRNVNGASFEETEELRSNLRNLIKTERLPKLETDNMKLSKYSQFFRLPKEALYITYESAIIDDPNAKCKNGNIMSVIPITQDEFHKVINNPFRGPNSRRALRLDSGISNNEPEYGLLEVVSKYNIGEYIIRYISKPTPIVLTDLSEINVFPEVEGKATDCVLDSSIHWPILERAVLLALNSKGIRKN